VIAAAEAAARLVLTAPEEFTPARFARFTSTLLGAPRPPEAARQPETARPPETAPPPDTVRQPGTAR